MSVNIISLNQMVDLFSGFADRHYFLNDFGFGPTSEIGTSRQMDFPYMWVSLNENSLINPQNRTAIPELSFSVLFMDKTNIQSNYLEINGDNSDNIQEILSDMLQVLQDFITEVQVDWGNYGIIFQDVINCFPATDETQDKVNGWVGQFSFKLKHSNCILPTGDIAQTNLSPINPMTRYLTCDTVTACTTLQQYIAQQINNFTGGTGNYVPYTGATQDVELGTFSMIMNDGITDSEMSPSFFAVEISGGSEFSLLEYNQLSLIDNNNLTSLFITPSGITFPNGSIQTTAFTGFTDTFVTGGTYSNGTATFSNNSGGTFNVNGFYTGETSYVNTLTTGVGLSANTTNGNITILNTLPDQTVVLNNGSNINVTGTYPTFTIGVTGLTDNNQFVTGYTYLDNTFTIADNSGNTFNATINTVTGLTVYNASTATRLIVDGDNNQAKIFSLRTGNLPRWAFRIDGNETGSNVSSDLGIRRYNDAGAFIDAPLTITRSTGDVTILYPKFTIELVNALSVDFYAPYNLSINTITNILNAPSITIYDDGVLYTLTNTIAVGSKITVVASTNSVVTLNSKRL